MRNPDDVFKELGQIYDLYREIARFRVKTKREPRDARKDVNKKIARTCAKRTVARTNK